MGKGRHVVPSGNGWAVKKPGASKPESNHRTQKAAEEAAKPRIKQEGGGELTISGQNGQFREKNTIAPAKDPYPPKG